MESQEHVNIVKKAYDYSVYISDIKSKLTRYHGERFRSRPVAPEHETLTVTYPEIKSTVKFEWIAFLFLNIIYYFAIYKPKKEADIERIKNSEEYRNECAQIEADVKRQQDEIDKKYELATKEYNEILIPKYENEKAEWQADLKSRIDKANACLTKAETELKALYEANKLIPLQYRTIDALEYIYGVISASEYSIRDAIDLYDKERDRRLAERSLREQQTANYLANEQNQIAQEQNDLLEERNEIAEKARREAAIANAIGTVQRHNTNSILKGK